MSIYKRINLGHGKFIDKHRQVVEEYLGRKLLSTEIIHHLDGNPKNDDITNLLVTTRSAHTKEHMKNGDLFKITAWVQTKHIKKMIDGMYQCSKCKEWKKPNSFRKNHTKSNGLECQCKLCSNIGHKRYRDRVILNKI